MDAQLLYTVRLSNGNEFGPAEPEMIVDWAKQRRIPVDALLVPSDGSAVRSVLAEPELRAILQSPPTSPTGAVIPPGESAVSQRLIPTRNPCALAGYYVAVFSILLAPLAPFALILGIIGLWARIKRPEVHGMAHAIFAIVVGLAISALCVVIFLAIMEFNNW